MNQENFNDVVYKDEELPFDRKIELPEMCCADCDKRIRTIYKEFSPTEKVEITNLHFQIQNPKISVSGNFP